MSERIDYIPFNKIKSIEIYENTNKLTLSGIVSSKKPDYAITGGILQHLMEAYLPSKERW